MLANFASHPEKSKGRLYPEITTPYRNAFQRDRDRIVHSNAFRRLQYKTQVFINHEGDHYRNRLTHSLEVANVARSIAQSLNVSADLAECIALAHDLGHSPFGHAGEEALNDCMKEYGGFSHNTYTVKLMVELEKRYVAYDGLNLTWEVIEGIIKHNGPITHSISLTLQSYSAQYNIPLNNFASIEAQIASLADDITYNCHDLEDGIKANLYTLKDLHQLPIIHGIIEQMQNEPCYHNSTPHRQIYEIVRMLSRSLIENLINNTRNNIHQFNILSIEDVRAHDQCIVNFSPDMLAELKSIRDFLFKKMYHHSKILIACYKCQTIVRQLFKLFFNNPQLIPVEWQTFDPINKLAKAQAIADYIAGMTDRYAIKQYNNFYNFSSLNF